MLNSERSGINQRFIGQETFYCRSLPNAGNEDCNIFSFHSETAFGINGIAIGVESNSMVVLCQCKNNPVIRLKFLKNQIPHNIGYPGLRYNTLLAIILPFREPTRGR